MRPRHWDQATKASSTPASLDWASSCAGLPGAGQWRQRTTAELWGHAAASRRIALQRPVAFGTPARPAMRPSPKLHPTSITRNNIELSYLRRTPCVGSSETASHFVYLRGQRCSGSVAVIPPRLCLASVGLCWPAFGGGGRLGLRSARGRLGRAGCSPTSQPSALLIKLHNNDRPYLLISPHRLSSFSLLTTVERCQH